MRTRLVLTTGLLLTAALAASCAHAYLLDQYFGVNPTLTYVSNWSTSNGTYSAYRFDTASLAPTLHTSTTDYQMDDWFGYWDSTIGHYVSYPGTGTYPSGEEPYDTEAYYFDDDVNNIYFAAIVGFPSPATGIYTESRYYNWPVVQGDFAIDLGESGSQTDAWGFNYNYGVDLTDEINPNSSTTNVSQLASNTLGNDLYHTTGGWYLGTPVGAVNPTPTSPSNAYTNFDPSVGTGMSYVADVTTNWYQLSLPNQENNWNTYVIEITIPKSLLPQLAQGDSLRYHWLAGCRNDGNEGVGYLTGGGDIDNPEPGTLALILAGVGPLGFWARRRRRTAGG